MSDELTVEGAIEEIKQGFCSARCYVFIKYELERRESRCASLGARLQQAVEILESEQSELERLKAELQTNQKKWDLLKELLDPEATAGDHATALSDFYKFREALKLAESA